MLETVNEDRTVSGSGMTRRSENISPPAQQPARDDIAPEVTLGDDGILRVDYSRHDCVTLASLHYVHARHVALCPSGKIPALFMGHHIGRVDYAAQRYISSPEVCAGISAGAIVVQSFFERHLGRMFLVYHRPPFPVRIFSDVAAALSWLRGFLPPG